jgi:hypothetical protein
MQEGHWTWKWDMWLYDNWEEKKELNQVLIKLKISHKEKKKP